MVRRTGNEPAAKENWSNLACCEGLNYFHVAFFPFFKIIHDDTDETRQDDAGQHEMT